MLRGSRFKAGLYAVAVVLGSSSVRAKRPHKPATPAGAAQRLPLETMLGPFPTVAAYCGAGAEAKAVGDRYRCLAVPNDWDTGARRGPRGHFLSARLLRVRGKLGPHEVEFCKVVMQTRQGWFVSNHAAPCKGRLPGGQAESTSLEFFRWADEIAPGIAMVHAHHTDQVVNESWRWWGSEVISRNSEPSRTSFTFCGMSADGVPSCTPTLDLCGDAHPIGIDQGRIEVPEPEVSPLYCLATWPAGTYALKLQGANPGPRSWMPHYVTPQEEQDILDKGQLAATAAYGPFPSIADYCQDLPSFEFDNNMPEKGLARETCSPRPGWSGSLGARGPLLETQLVSVKNNDVDIPEHYCRVALRTKLGWYVTTDNEPCRGNTIMLETGTGLKDTRARAPRWLDNGKGGAVLLDALHTDLSGTCRQVRLCGIGPSGMPSCTPWVNAGSQGSHEIRLASNQLKIAARSQRAQRTKGDSDDRIETSEGDDDPCPVERDSYELSFP